MPTSSYVCPVCGRPMMSASELCSGSFLDTDHPSNVEAVVGSLPVYEPGSHERAAKAALRDRQADG